MSKSFEIHASPLTGNIYAGKPLKSGTWGADKKDVTTQAMVAVAKATLCQGGKVQVVDDNEKPIYTIEVTYHE